MIEGLEKQKVNKLRNVQKLVDWRDKIEAMEDRNLFYLILFDQIVNHTSFKNYETQTVAKVFTLI